MKRIGLVMLGIGALSCIYPEEPERLLDTALTIVPDAQQRLDQFSPTEMSVDLSAFSETDRQVLRHLVLAAQQMDEIFLRQVWSGNPDLRSRLAARAETAAGAATADPVSAAANTYFQLNYGPFDRLAEFEPFVGDQEHPPGAGYYPEDLTKEEFEAWLEEHPEDRGALTGLTTLVRRSGAGLEAVPYSDAYRQWLKPAAQHLRAAAQLADNESLKRFLNLRAEAFLTDDYVESDMAWMDLDSSIEVTIGPYETYEDDLFGYKAAFEAYVTLTLPEDSAALARYKSELPWLERNLPIPEEHKNLDRGTASPIRVVDELFTSGDARAGVQTLAFNLPNDERVREAKGSKKVLLRNVMRAKYEKILMPIAERVLPEEDREQVSFDAYFNEVLHHELGHGLGPGKIRVDGRETEVRLELKEHYSTLEEAKADVMGVYNILALIDKGVMPAELRRSLEPTYVAGLFRAARFGVHEAHGQGVVSQFNYLLERGALEVDDKGRFRVVSVKFADGIGALLREMLMLQATGDYPGTSRFLATYGQPSEALLNAIDRLSEVPVDIRPLYPQADELLKDG